MNMLSSLSILLFCTSLVSPALVQDQFENFKRKFNKNYDEVEEAYRMSVFESNMKIINKHNKGYKSGKYSWYMGINQFTDLTPEEFNQLNNLRMPEVSKRDFVYEMKAKKIAEAVDWREKGIVTDVKNQGCCGSCWAFAAVASIEAAHAQKYGKLISMSEQQLVDCEDGNDCKHGGLPEEGWAVVKEQGGIESEDSYPYVSGSICHKLECRFEKQKIVSKVSNFTQSSQHFDGNELNLMKRLNDHPQTVSIDGSALHFYSGGILHNTVDHPCSDIVANHAAFVVGYGSEGKEEFYIVKNSWGKTWGEDGYVRIARNDGNTCGIANYPGHAEA